MPKWSMFIHVMPNRLLPTSNPLRRARRAYARRGAAFTMIEATIFLGVFAIVCVGVGVGMQSAVRVPEGTDAQTAISTELTSEIETWRSTAFGAAPWPSTLPYSVSDTVTINVCGQSVLCTRAVSIQKWDPTNIASNSSPQSDFARVQITINGQTLTAYLTKPV